MDTRKIEEIIAENAEILAEGVRRDNVGAEPATITEKIDKLAQAFLRYFQDPYYSGYACLPAGHGLSEHEYQVLIADELLEINEMEVEK